jgi:Alpha mannosidase middle domain
MLEASFKMFDVMGVNQHHDAVTGTGKQAVANDYAWRIFKGMESSNIEYAALI